MVISQQRKCDIFHLRGHVGGRFRIGVGLSAVSEVITSLTAAGDEASGAQSVETDKFAAFFPLGNA